jgi:hypothetical protein
MNVAECKVGNVENAGGIAEKRLGGFAAPSSSRLLFFSLSVASQAPSRPSEAISASQRE